MFFSVLLPLLFPSIFPQNFYIVYLFMAALSRLSLKTKQSVLFRSCQCWYYNAVYEVGLLKKSFLVATLGVTKVITLIAMYWSH
jgi:hypothetical protein